MIPGKKYRPEDFLEIAWRRVWYILVPLVVVSIGTFVWSQTLPDRYKSEAVVLIVPPQVPDNYVRPAVTEGLEERLEALRQEITSRPRLERIIMDLDLYPELRKRTIMDEVVAAMRRDIDINVPRARRRMEPGSFTVGYSSEEPKTAMIVAERLASLFVQGNIESRSVKADATNRFLQAQLEEARRGLQAHEQRLEAFRRANAGRLPSDAQFNLQVMRTNQDDLQTLLASITQDRERQLSIERTIADESAIAELAAKPAPRPQEATSPQTASEQLEAARNALAQMQLRLKPDHPDVKALKRRIAELEPQALEEAVQLAAGGPAAVRLSPEEVARTKRIAGLRAEYDALERQMANKREQVERLRGTVDQYKGRLEAAPTLEAQLTQLQRDYDTMQSTYRTLLLKSQDAAVAASLETRQIGEQFRIIDPARLPAQPTSPDRVRLNLLGVLVGLALGIAMAAALEYRDTSLRTEEDVLLALSLPVMAIVPMMQTTQERGWRRRRRLLLASSAIVLVVAGAVLLTWHTEVVAWWGR